MKRVGLLAAVLAALGAMMLAAGCSGDAQKRQSPATVSMPTGAAKPRTLAGSFVMDLTWISDRTGWALAGAPCALRLCPMLARTKDGGRTWHLLPAPPGFIQSDRVDCSKRPCVAHIRFATALVGYLFGPALFVTRDGGRSWAREQSPPVEALEPSAGSVVRLVYDHTGCPGPCNRTVGEAPAGSTSWRTLLRIRFPLSDSRASSAEVIRRGGRIIYLPIYGDLAAGAGTQHTILFRSLDGGGTWRRLRDPCGGHGFKVHDAVALAAAGGGFLAALCLPRTSAPRGRFVLTSTDEGSSWGPHHPVPGFASVIAAASRTHLVVATGPGGGSGPVIYRLAVSADGGAHWKTVITDRERINPSAPGSAFLGFEDAEVGRWVGYERAIWTTQDGGMHWIRRAFP
jgi:photosystem II stability/assembly factor-like uncharacterized protein